MLATAAAAQPSLNEVMAVRPGDMAAAGGVDGWFLDYAGSRDPALRDTSWRLHVPRPLKEQALRVCQMVDQLQQTLGRAPTTSELAERLQVAEEQVLEALAVAHSRQELSLDRPVGDDTELCLGDLVAAPVAHEEAEDLLLLPRLGAALPEPDRTVIVLRFFADLTQDEIATRVGFSQMHVSRLLRRALGCLRAQLLDPEQLGPVARPAARRSEVPAANYRYP